jgi:hypothetical protein
MILTKQDGKPYARIKDGRLELVRRGADYLADSGRLDLPRTTILTAARA